jgi:hypothetical protein
LEHDGLPFTGGNQILAVPARDLRENDHAGL